MPNMPSAVICYNKSMKIAANPYYKRYEPEMTIRPLSADHAAQLCGWSYEPPYQLYNWPRWEDMIKDGIEFGDPFLREQQYAAVVDQAEELVGFAQFFPLVGTIRLGMGLRPDLCGQGLGSRLARLLAEEALRRRPDDEVDLEVLSWNVRAVRAYVRAGFRLTDTYTRLVHGTEAECHCLVYSPADSER